MSTWGGSIAGHGIAVGLFVVAAVVGSERCDAQEWAAISPKAALVVPTPCTGWGASLDGRWCGQAGFVNAGAEVSDPLTQPAGQDTGRGTVPFAASLVVPGAGQWLLGQRRWAGYVLLETLGWVAYLDRRRTGGRLRDDYQSLAWDVARSGFGGVRVDGNFDYYEDVANFTRSGRFDVDPVQEGVQPETDIGTFNGQVWDLARGLFFPEGQPAPTPGSPAHQQAIDFYLRNGYSEAFLWDWGPNAMERSRFRSLISESDEALRRATLVLGLIGVNHLFSAVDALVSARLRASGRGEVETSLLPAPRGRGWELGVRWIR